MAPRDEQDDLESAHTDKSAGSDLSRRNFLKTVGAAGVATTVGDAAVHSHLAAQSGAQQAAGPPRQNERRYTPIRDEVASNLIKRGIVGYADRLRVQPGDTIKFMVSSERPRYRADIVRLIHGDANPKGPGIKEIVVETGANTDYPGRHQELPLGSYAIVPDNSALRIRSSFTFAAWIAPTSQRGDGADAFSGVEGILTKAGGYAVVIDEAGRLSLWLTAADGRTEKIAAGQPLRIWVPAIPGMNARPQGVTTVWSFVAVSFDAASGKVVLHQDPLNDFPFDASRGISERSTAIKTIATSDAPLLLAALRDPSGTIGGHYNGKIDNPRLYDRVLSPQEIAEIAKGRGPADALAAWDFSIDIETDRISDTSSRKLHGRVVNLPMRAVTGHNWDSYEMDYKRARSQYGAIYFHDDDIDDAKWDVGVEFRVPAGLKSGLYAARLRNDVGEDYVPFTVRPPKGRPAAKIALLIPTFSYLAYGGTGTSSFRPLSLYSRHSDGSGVCYSSRLRPITNMRPKIQTNNPWQFMADTHLVDWLEVKGFGVDFYTD